LGNIPAGGQSKLLVVQTNAVDFLPSFASVIDGSVTVVASWAPITQIPEPSTCVLAGMGLVGLVIGVARRRRS
jgi:MYXO-CTERM domain-containing protein